MTNFDKMEQHFVALTEEELTDVNGGLIITAAGIILAGKVAGAVVTIGGALYGAGYAIGKALRP